MSILSAERLREIDETLTQYWELTQRGHAPILRNDCAALLADARAMRELVRRALAQYARDYGEVCAECGRPVYPPTITACECAPGVSWVRDAVAAGLHEEVGP